MRQSDAWLRGRASIIGLGLLILIGAFADNLDANERKLQLAQDLYRRLYQIQYLGRVVFIRGAMGEFAQAGAAAAEMKTLLAEGHPPDIHGNL